MPKFLLAFLLIPSFAFASPKYLAQKSFPAETEVSERAEIVALYKAEFARQGSQLRKALADILKEYGGEDPSSERLAEVDENDLWFIDTGGSGGHQSTSYLIAIKAYYKRSVSIVAYLHASSTYSEREEDSGLTVRLERRGKVTIR